MSNQEMRITSAAAELVDAANAEVLPARMVSKGATREIVRRSMAITDGLPFSLREHLALRDVSHFISVCQTGKSQSLTPRNTDLLPLCHPMSTKAHRMSQASLYEAHARWVASDPDITDDSARALIAAAYQSVPGSDEHTYFTNRIASLPAGTVPLRAITAAFGDGNSRAARSARARLQRRDRKGRFAWMGGGLSAFVRRSNGVVNRLSGRAVAQGVGSDDVFDIELADGRIARVPAKAAEANKAYLPSPDAPDGFSPEPAKVNASDPVVNESDIQFVDAPYGFAKDENYTGPGERFSDDAYEVIKFDPNDDAAPETMFDGKRVDFNKPVYVLRREGATPKNMDFAAQSWADVQDYIRRDEVDLDREEGRTPDPIAVLDDDQIEQLREAAGDRDPYEVVNELFGGRTEKPETARGEAPEGAYVIDRAEAYIAEGRTDQESKDYTDDPSELANRVDDYSDDDLIAALKGGVMPADGVPSNGLAQLPFEAGDEYVPAEAIYEAIKERGLDADGILDAIYRGETPKAPEPVAELPEAEAPEADVEATPLPALLEGLSDDEKAQIRETGDYKPFLPENDPWDDDAPGGYYVPDSAPFENVDEDPRVDPMRLANEVEQPDLEDALREAIEPGAQIPGYGTVNETDADGEAVATSVPAEASRDALQLQGVDTNAVINGIYDEARGDVEPAEVDAADIFDEIVKDEPVTQDERNSAADIAAEFGYSEEAVDLIRNGGTRDEIIDALNAQVLKPKGVMFGGQEVIPYEQDLRDYETRMDVDNPRAAQNDKWAKFGKMQDVIDRLQGNAPEEEVVPEPEQAPEPEPEIEIEQPLALEPEQADPLRGIMDEVARLREELAAVREELAQARKDQDGPAEQDASIKQSELVEDINGALDAANEAVADVPMAEGVAEDRDIAEIPVPEPAPAKETKAKERRRKMKVGKGAAANGWDNATPKMPILDRLVGRDRLPRGEGERLGAARSLLKKFVAGWDARGNLRPRPTHRIVQRDQVGNDAKYVDMNGNIIRPGDIVAHNRAGELVNPDREAVNIIKGEVLRRHSYERNGVVREGGLTVRVLEADDPEWVGREFFYVARMVEIVEQPDLKNQIIEEDKNRELPFEESVKQSLWNLNDRYLYAFYGSALDSGNAVVVDLVSKELAARNLMVPQNLADFLALVPDESLDFIPSWVGDGEGVHGSIVKRIVENERRRRREGEDGPVKLPNDIFNVLAGENEVAPARPAPAPAPAPEAVPTPEPTPEPSAPAGFTPSQIRERFKAEGAAFVDANGEEIAAKVEDVKLGDFMKSKFGTYGQVVRLNQVVDGRGERRMEITVQYPNGKQYSYRPYRLNTNLNGVYRVPTISEPSPATPEAPEANVPETPEIVIPQAPEPRAIDIKQAKALARDLIAKINEKPVPNGDEIGVSQNAVEYHLNKVKEDLAPAGADRRRDKGLNQALDDAIKVMKYFGWFDEAQQLIAIRARKDQLPLREMPTDFNEKIDNLRTQGFVDFIKLKKQMKALLPRWQREELNNLREAFDKIAIYPDQYDRTYRAGRQNANAAINALRKRNEIQNDASAMEALNNFEAMLNDLGDLPPLPRPKRAEGGDMPAAVAQALADFNGMDVNQLRNGTGDWEYAKALSNGINKVYLLRNRNTNEYVIIKQDDDYQRRGGKQFKGNGINAEEMVAMLYRDLGFAMPAVRVINPDAQEIEDRGIAVMEYAGDGFFGLERIGVAADRYEANGDINNIMPEHQAEILNFLVANGVIGNTDRHGNNYMYGQDPDTGKWRLIPIDNGLAFFNGAFGEADKQMPDALYLRPDRVIRGAHGNRNGAMQIGRQYIGKIGEQAAKDQIREFALRMQERARVLQFIDDRAGDYVDQRAQWIIDNLDKYLDGILGRR